MDAVRWFRKLGVVMGALLVAGRERNGASEADGPSLGFASDGCAKSSTDPATAACPPGGLRRATAARSTAYDLRAI